MRQYYNPTEKTREVSVRNSQQPAATLANKIYPISMLIINSNYIVYLLECVANPK
jgi:hypothetical protein